MPPVPATPVNRFFGGISCFVPLGGVQYSCARRFPPVSVYSMVIGIAVPSVKLVTKEDSPPEVRLSEALVLLFIKIFPVSSTAKKMVWLPLVSATNLPVQRAEILSQRIGVSGDDA